MPVSQCVAAQNPSQEPARDPLAALLGDAFPAAMLESPCAGAAQDPSQELGRDPFAALLGGATCEATLRVCTGGGVALRLQAASNGGGCWRSALMRTSAGAGRFMLAASDVAAGTVVCEAPAHCVCAFEEWRKRACACCFQLATGRLTVRCADCEHAFYCSEECRRRHWARGSAGTAPHAHLCRALQRFAPLRKYGKSTANVLRLLFECLAVCHATEPPPEAVASDAMVGAGGEGAAAAVLLAAGSTPEASLAAAAEARSDAELHPARAPVELSAHERFRLFDALQHHPPSWSHPKEALEWAKACGVFRSVLAHAAWWTEPLPSDTELFALVSRLDSNIFGCFVRDGGALFGQACYLQAATFNHACAPNCSATSGVACMRIVADEHIPAGAQLSIAYIEVNRPREARRKLLQDHYNFACGCERCCAEAIAGGRAKLRYEGGGARRGRGGGGGRDSGAAAAVGGAGGGAGAADAVAVDGEGAPAPRTKKKAVVSGQPAAGKAAPWFEALA